MEKNKDILRVLALASGIFAVGYLLISFVPAPTDTVKKIKTVKKTAKVIKEIVDPVKDTK